VGDTVVTGYSLVLPPGWRRVPLLHGTKASVKKIIDQKVRRFPPQVSPDKRAVYRAQLERLLYDLAKQARSSGGSELYLPVEAVHGTVMPASFVVTESAAPGDGPTDAAGAIAFLTASGGSDVSAVILDGVAGARSERIAPPEPGQQFDAGSRRVDYVIPLPGRENVWLILTFSTLGDGDPAGDFAKLLVELFDSIMRTLRWQENEQ
jgi:hypothetical protein